MLAGKHERSAMIYLVIAVVVVALLCVGFWSRYHTHDAPVRAPLHDQK